METERSLTVKLSVNSTNNKFFIDFWDGSTFGNELDSKYLVSVNISENVALCISRDLGIKILQ